MNILHLNTERGWRGGERQTLWLAGALAARGHGSPVACRPGGPLARASADAGRTVTAATPLFEFDPFAAARLRRFLSDARVDVLHAHTGHAVGLGALAAWGTRTKFVVTRRVDFPLRRNLPSRWKYRRADAVACISTRVREEVLAAGVPEEKTRIIPSGIDPSGYPSVKDRGRLRRDRGLGQGEWVVVHAGAMVPHKDQATLLRAAQRVMLEGESVRFILLGEGPLRRSLEKAVREMGLSGRVDFLGARPDVLEWVALADVFVFPSKEEGLGTALLDALALGVPTCAARAGGIPDIYGDPAAPEMTPPGDDEALARNILSVLRDPDEARRRVERGRERAGLFTVDKMASAYERLYEDLCRS